MGLGSNEMHCTKHELPAGESPLNSNLSNLGIGFHIIKIPRQPLFFPILTGCAIMMTSEVTAMRILCFGDSNTYGYDPRGYLGDRYGAEDRWVDRLAKQTGHEMINAGANGRDIPHFSSISNLFAQYGSVDTLLVMLGTNDLLQGCSAKETAKRMEHFLQVIIPCCKRILLVAPPPMQRGAWVDTDALVTESRHLAEEYSTLADRMGIPFADTRCWNVETAFDGVHFTEVGHHTFADHMKAYL